MHLPFIFHDINSKVPLLWAGVINLINTINIIFSTKISKEDLERLQREIEAHLKCILEVYKESLTPKHHIMTHYPTVIEQIGPIIHTWSMRFEAKQKYFNKMSSGSGNYINICKSLSQRHQQMIAQKIKTMSFEENFTFGKVSKVKLTKKKDNLLERTYS